MNSERKERAALQFFSDQLRSLVGRCKHYSSVATGPNDVWMGRGNCSEDELLDWIRNIELRCVNVVFVMNGGRLGCCSDGSAGPECTKLHWHLRFSSSFNLNAAVSTSGTSKFKSVLTFGKWCMTVLKVL